MENAVNRFWDVLAAGSANEVAELLREHPDYANKVDAQGSTPLQLAARSGASDKVDLLLRSGALLNQPSTDRFKEMPLHAALRGPNETLELCRKLVLSGAELNAKDADARTPLHLAVMRGEMTYVQMLVEEGADPALKDARDRSSFDYAREQNREDIMDVLRGALS